MRNKPDANQPTIVKQLRALGVFVRPMARDAGFDLLLGFRGRLHVVELKDGTLPPSHRQLTPHEVTTAAELRAVGVALPVCVSLEDVLHVLAGDA